MSTEQNEKNLPIEADESIEKWDIVVYNSILNLGMFLSVWLGLYYD